MYWILGALVVALFLGAVIYENHRQKQIWSRFYESLNRLKVANSEPCSS